MDLEEGDDQMPPCQIAADRVVGGVLQCSVERARVRREALICNTWANWCDRVLMENEPVDSQLRFWGSISANG